MSKSSENEILSGWKLKLGLITMLLVPTITATGAFYDLKSKITEREIAVNQKISDLELSTQKTFADKEALKEMRSDIKEMRSEMAEIKTLILKRPTRY